jgi:tRNA(Ile)-lysidine synthase
MLKSFYQYITDKQLFCPPDRILLAVSGGMDSVAMCHLFYQADQPFAIAHCNFKLRGAESDEDQEFVQKLAASYNVPFHVIHFDTEKFARDKKVSIQMAARELRYAWFNALLHKEKYNYLATAHHKNDLLETVLLNLTRGTGISGLHGIKPKAGNVIRPILFATREEINQYVLNENLSWREDSSNSSVKYQRNSLRHEVIPILKKINPNLEETIEQSIEKISAVENIFHAKVNEIKQLSFKQEKETIYLDREILLSQVEPAIILYEILKDYNFSYREIINLINITETGKKIESESHIAVKDRTQFIITPRKTDLEIEYKIEKNDRELNLNNSKLTFSCVDNKNFEISRSPDIGCLDFDKLRFPLILRNWQEGDSFFPLGMSQKKKISDFLIDSKVPLTFKHNVKVLVSDGQIAWVIGHRIDNRFKISETTEKIFLLKNEIL